MDKNISLVIQARLGSQRIPSKMLKPFAETTLVDILLKKVSNLKSIGLDKVYFCAYEDELLDVASKYSINTIKRSKESSQEEKDIKVLFEWYKQIPTNYLIMVSACNPLLKIKTIDKFIKQYKTSDKEGAISVYESKNYFWNSGGEMLNKWPKGFTSMNTKFVEITKVASHCMYGSRVDIIGGGYWVNKGLPYEPELVSMPEIEAFDIDEPWQFKVAEQLYKNREELWKK
jgi:CMP-N-acetylneuraminic acid synthetase